MQCVSPSGSLLCQEHKEQGNVYSLQAVSLAKVTVWGLNQPAGLSTLRIAFFPVFQGNWSVLKLEASKTLHWERACSGLKRSYLELAIPKMYFRLLPPDSGKSPRLEHYKKNTERTWKKRIPSLVLAQKSHYVSEEGGNMMVVQGYNWSLWHQLCYAHKWEEKPLPTRMAHHEI